MRASECVARSRPPGTLAAFDRRPYPLAQRRVGRRQRRQQVAFHVALGIAVDGSADAHLARMRAPARRAVVPAEAAISFLSMCFSMGVACALADAARAVA